MKEDCVFCQIANGNASAEIVFQNEHIVVFQDNNPQAPVHLLTIPRKHISRIHDITEVDQELIGRMIYAAKHQAEERGLHETGYRLVFNNGREGGQAVYHVHLHLLGGRPMRWPPG